MTRKPIKLSDCVSWSRFGSCASKGSYGGIEVMMGRSESEFKRG